MYGAGRGETTLVGVGLFILGKKSEGIVEIEDLTIKGGENYGLWLYDGMNVIMRGCTVKKCEGTGVEAYEADISCDDLQVVGCGGSGVCASYGGTVKLSGETTRIEGNVTSGNGSTYGLHPYDSSSKIQIVTPLTKDTISFSNSGGGNWGGDGTIEQVSVYLGKLVRKFN